MKHDHSEFCAVPPRHALDAALRKRGGYVTINQLDCGDLVTLDDDERHVGRIAAIYGVMAKIRWRDTGWVTWVDDADRLVRVVED